MIFPQPGDIVYTPEQSVAYVKEVTGFLDADMDGRPEWFYIRLMDGSEARVVAYPMTDAGQPPNWMMDRRIG